MKTARDDAERLRIRDASFGVEVSQSGRDQWQGMPCLLARTTTIKSFPTLAQSFYGCSPLTILGTEVEGGVGTLTAGTSTFLALNVGSAVPPIGASVLVTFVDNRWVFRYDA